MRYAVIPPFLAIAFVSVTAEAHIRLDLPKGRYVNDPQQNTKQKQGPCGVTNDTRTTKSDLITTFEPGQMITVEWTETVNHPGHFRIAFSEKGQSFPEATVEPGKAGGQILADDIPDDKAGGKFTHSVTLPNVSCDTCTLQLIQVMSDSGDFYFQCADLILKSSGSAGGAGGSAGSGGSAGGVGGASTAGKGGQGGAGKSSGGAGGASGGGASGSSSQGGSLVSAGAGGTLATGGGSALVPRAGTGGVLVATGGSTTTGGTTGGTLAATGGTVSTPSTGGTTTVPTGSSPPADDAGGCGIRAARTNGSLALLALASMAALARRRRKSKLR